MALVVVYSFTIAVNTIDSSLSLYNMNCDLTAK